MKIKLFIIILTLLSLNSFAKIKVATSFTILADMTKNVAGDYAQVNSITKFGAEIHDYEPTPKDMVKAEGADLIFYNGLGLERWFERFFENLETKAEKVVLTEGIEPLSVYGGEFDGYPNPHAWLSPKNAIIYVENIQKALSQKDPKNAMNYEKNARIYLEKISKIDETIKKEVAKIPQEKRVLITSEGAFSYWTKEYGFQEDFIWAINSEQQASPKKISALIKKIKEQKIPVVFSESTISNKAIRQVAREAKVKYGGVLFVDSLSDKKGKVPTYLDLLKTTSFTIIKGFSDE